MLSSHSKSDEIAEKAMQLLLAHRRVLTSDMNCQHDNRLHCFSLHLNKIRHQIHRGEQIEFVLPAFPAKSPNLNKTAGALPDLGERLALRFLNHLCQQIQSFYPPGAQVLICSDGRVFNDLVKVPDAHVDAYAAGIRHILREEALTHITTFSLDDYYDVMPYEAMREKLVEHYGEPVSVIKSKMKTDEATKQLFNGIHRFIYEDQLPLFDFLSKNQVKHITKEIAYHVIQRSNAWSRFVEKHFTASIRLSIHPQFCGSEKLGIMLLQSNDAWATPWHRVVLYNGKDHKLVRKIDAEEMGAKPVFVNNQFSHYEAGVMKS